MNRRAVITGIGVVSPIGIGKDEFLYSLKKGRCGIDKLTLFDPGDLPSRVSAEVKDFDPGKYMPVKEMKRMGRSAQLSIAGVKYAIRDSMIRLSEEKKVSCPVFIGTAVGGMDYAEESFHKLFYQGSAKMPSYAGIAVFCASVSSVVSAAWNLHGKSISISDGCCSSTDAIAMGMHAIQNGENDVVVCGGADACVSKGVMAAFCKMGVVTTNFNDSPKKACRPFHKDRDGFALGEGAWIFIVEEYERALKRGANMYAEICGYGATCDSYHPSHPHPDGTYNMLALEQALKMANLEKHEVCAVSSYGNGTRINDPLETKMYKKFFGDLAYEIPMGSIKSMIGHPIGATGAAQVAAAALSIKENFIPPTIHLDDPDPECDLDYVHNRARIQKVDNVLINTLSFGGKNSALVLRKV